MKTDHRQSASDKLEESTTNTSRMEKIAVAESDPPTSVFAMDEVENEPRVHIRTWIALASMWIFNFAGVLALTGPPTIVSLHARDSHEQLLCFC